MKREELTALGLSDEQVTKVMALHGTDIEGVESKGKEQLTAVTAERDGLKEQVSQRDKDLKELKKGASASEELQAKLDSLQSKYDDDTKSLEAQISNTKMDAALTKALAGSKARNVDDLRKFINPDKLKLDDDGTLTGVDAQIEALQKDKPYLFAGEPNAHYQPAGGSEGAGADVAKAIANPEINLTKALAENKGE